MKRPNVGLENYQVQRLIAKYGDHLMRNNPFRVRAAGILGRCKKFNIKTDFEHPLELALYLRDITPKRCPVFNKPLSAGVGMPHDFSPSVDRINPRKGYVRGNMQVISMRANLLKQDATKSQLKKFANWVMEGGPNGRVR